MYAHKGDIRINTWNKIMIRTSFFYQELASYGINFYTGVPDSLLKNLCAYVTDHAKNHIIAANEGGAMGIAAGHPTCIPR